MNPAKYASALLIAGAFLAQTAAVFAQATAIPPTAAPAYPAYSGQPGVPGTAAGVPAGEHRPEHEGRHPEIHKAMKRLEAAKADLQKAAHDYDGHRAQAVQLIDQAEAQLRLGLQDEEQGRRH